MLVVCGGCGKRISDRAPVCPFCKAAAHLPVASALPPAADQRSQPAAEPEPAVAHPAAASPPPPPSAPPAAHLLALKPGDFVGDSLQILKVLGEGGFGIVYQAISHTTKGVYALKTIRDQLLRDDATRAMLRKEAQIWIDLGRHPNLVQLHFLDEVGGRLFLAMELVAKDANGVVDLDGHLARKPPLNQCLQWAVQACHGLEYAFTRGIRCHRDLKPANILITPDGTVKVSDFGIAGLAVAPPTPAPAPAAAPVGPVDLGRTAAGTAFGTPTHMPPEQFVDAARCDQRSDVYAFGVVLYQMATGGRLPFLPGPMPGGPELGARLWRAMAELHFKAPVPPLDSPLAPIIGRCLAKRPDQRYPSFAALRAELERLLASRGAAVPAAPRVSGLKGWEMANQGVSLAALGRWPEALAAYDRALALGDERVATIHANRANALRHLDRVEEAVAAADHAIAIDPTTVAAWVNKGLTLAAVERDAEAVPCLKRAVELDPLDTEAWVGLGVVLTRHGQREQGIACFRRALDADPRQVDALYNLGNELLAQRQLGPAVEALDRCLGCAPGHARAWLTKGIVLAEAGRFDAALPCLDEAVRLEPTSPHAWYNRGNALVPLGRLEEAHACFAETVRLAPEVALAWNNKGLAELRLGRHADAVVSLREFLARGGWQEAADNAKVAGLVAQLEAGLEPARPSGAPAFQAAERSAQAAAEAAGRGELDPGLAPPTAAAAGPPPALLPPSPRDRIRALNDRCTELFGRRQYDAALACCEEALALDPLCDTTLNNRANCVFCLGRHAEALELQARLLELNPLFLQAWLSRGAMQKIAGRDSEALRTLQDLVAAAADQRELAAGAQRELAPLLAKGLKPAPRPPLGWLLAGYLAATRQQVDQAVQCFQSAIAAAPRAAAPWYWMGEVLVQADRLNKALTCFDEATRRDPRDPLPLHAKGRTLARLGRHEEAVACFDRAVAAAPRHTASWSDRGKALGALKRLAEAVDSLERACALDPGAPAPWLNRALAEEELGRPADALRSFELFLATAGSGDQERMAAQLTHARRRVAALRALLAAGASAP